MKMKKLSYRFLIAHYKGGNEKPTKYSTKLIEIIVPADANSDISMEYAKTILESRLDKQDKQLSYFKKVESRITKSILSSEKYIEYI